MSEVNISASTLKEVGTALYNTAAGVNIHQNKTTTDASAVSNANKTVSQNNESEEIVPPSAPDTPAKTSTEEINTSKGDSPCSSNSTEIMGADESSNSTKIDEIGNIDAENNNENVNTTNNSASKTH